MRNILAMILAGGVGKRLSILSMLRAKPAVPFGGIYRIIDFTLSNAMNSGLTHVAVLPQYKPLSLIEHIGIGLPWDFNGRTRSINILPPSTGKKSSDWYQGTADAIRQNLDYIRNFDPEIVLILSGDHIYHMDYMEMINYHRARGADVTIGMIRVPIEAANQFGIAALDEDGRILDWEEKPSQPKSDMASMGIYVFSTPFLIEQLETLTGNDFGHDLIPIFVQRHRAYGYPFEGYWRDVGTLQTYWESNMEIYGEEMGIDLRDWNVATNFEEEGRIGDRPPMCVTSTGSVVDSFLSHGCVIEGLVEHSVLSPGVHVDKGAVVRNSVVFHDTHIGADSQLNFCIIDKNVRIGRNCRLGKPDAGSGHLCVVGKWAVIPDGARLGKYTKVYPLTDLARYGRTVVPDFEEVGEPPI